jgi:uncharacterized protein (TIGR01777 family)
MRLLITGGTGFIGGALCQRLRTHGHQLVVLSRSAARQPPREGVTFLPWDSGEWPRAAEGCEGVVNLAGESIVAKRWTPQQKQRIRDSRVETTRRLVDALAALPRKPAVLISASAVGYYGARDDERLTEADPAGTGFLADTCRDWEAEAQRAQRLGVRVVRLRIGLVLAAGGGALSKMVPPFRAFLGGPLGSGRQWVSWIHREDVIGLIEWALQRSDAAGAVNATAPEPVTMGEFCRCLARVLRRPSWAPVPAVVLRALLGDMADVLLTGQRVVPAAALRAGYAFQFSDLLPALQASLA